MDQLLQGNSPLLKPSTNNDVPKTKKTKIALMVIGTFLVVGAMFTAFISRTQLYKGTIMMLIPAPATLPTTREITTPASEIEPIGGIPSAPQTATVDTSGPTATTAQPAAPQTQSVDTSATIATSAAPADVATVNTNAPIAKPAAPQTSTVDTSGPAATSAAPAGGVTTVNTNAPTAIPAAPQTQSVDTSATIATSAAPADTATRDTGITSLTRATPAPAPSPASPEPPTSTDATPPITNVGPLDISGTEPVNNTNATQEITKEKIAVATEDKQPTPAPPPPPPPTSTDATPPITNVGPLDISGTEPINDTNTTQEITKEKIAVATEDKDSSKAKKSLKGAKAECYAKIAEAPDAWKWDGEKCAQEEKHLATQKEKNENTAENSLLSENKTRDQQIEELQSKLDYARNLLASAEENINSAPQTPANAQQEQSLQSLTNRLGNIEQQLSSIGANNNNANISSQLQNLAGQVNSLMNQASGRAAAVSSFAAAPAVSCSNPTFVYDSTRRVCVPPAEVVISQNAQIATARSGSGNTGNGLPTNTSTPATASQSASSIGVGAAITPGSGSPNNTGTPATASQSSSSVGVGAATTPGSGVGAGNVQPRTRAIHGSYIRGNTGPEILVYPIFISAANGLYYLLRRRRRK